VTRLGAIAPIAGAAAAVVGVGLDPPLHPARYATDINERSMQNDTAERRTIAIMKTLGPYEIAIKPSNQAILLKARP
jgi:hypothetical protein